MWIRELTYVLLKDDYNLQLDIPIDQLCPAVPNRANYILWLSDLLKESSDLPTPIRGIDMYVDLTNIFFVPPISSILGLTIPPLLILPQWDRGIVYLPSAGGSHQ